MRASTRWLLVTAALLVTVGCNGNTLTNSGGGDGDEDMASPLVFDVQPATLQTLSVSFGQTGQSVTYSATYGGQAVNVAWTLDRGEIATIGVGPAPTTAVTATGTTGGIVTVSTNYNGQLLTRQVLVRVTGTQNGANPGNPAESNQIPRQGQSARHQRRAH